MLQQLRGGAEADIVRHRPSGQHPNRATILRVIGPFGLRPQPMKDKTEVANFTRTLEPGYRVAHAPTAIFGAPTECQHIAVYRRAPYFGGWRQFQGWARQKFGRLALPRLRHRRGRLERRHDSYTYEKIKSAQNPARYRQPARFGLGVQRRYR